MNEQFIFSVRVCAAFISFLVSVLLIKDTAERVVSKHYDLAFLLVLSCAGLAIGTCCALSWSAIYQFTLIAHRPADWMINSAFIPCYTALMMGSALVLLRALTVSTMKTIFCIGTTFVAAVMAYIWIGYYV